MTRYQTTRLLNCSRVHPLNPRADPAQNLVRDRSDLRRHLAYVDDVGILRSDDHDFIPGRHVQPCDIGHEHIHVDRADNWGSAAPNQHRSAAGEPQIETVGIARGYDRDRRWLLGVESHAIADTLTRSHAFYRHDTARE